MQLKIRHFFYEQKKVITLSIILTEHNLLKLLSIHYDLIIKYCCNWIPFPSFLVLILNTHTHTNHPQRGNTKAYYTNKIVRVRFEVSSRNGGSDCETPSEAFHLIQSELSLSGLQRRTQVFQRRRNPASGSCKLLFSFPLHLSHSSHCGITVLWLMCFILLFFCTPCCVVVSSRM